jgi:hypothetical protein
VPRQFKELQKMRKTVLAAAFGLSAPFLLTSAAVAQAPTTESFVNTVAISDKCASRLLSAAGCSY